MTLVVVDRQCNQEKPFREFRVTGRGLGLPLGLIAASRDVEEQINVMHYFMWRNAVKLFPNAELPAPSQTIPHPFKIKTEYGIETRSSYLASNFVGVIALLAEELSEFLDYWEYVVKEEVSKSAKLLRNELQVPILSIIRLFDIHLAISTASNVFEPFTKPLQKKLHKNIYMISAVLLVLKSPHSVDHSTILLNSVPKRSSLLKNVGGATSKIRLQLQPSSVV